MSETHQIVYNIMLNRFGQASQLLQKNGCRKLALIVASGQRVAVKEASGKLDIQLIMKALENNIDDLLRQHLFGNWFELLAVCLCQSKTVAAALTLFYRFKQPEDSPLFRIIELYGQKKQLTADNVEKICMLSTPMSGFLLSFAFRKFYQEGNRQEEQKLEKLQNRILIQLMAETKAAHFQQYYAGPVWVVDRIFGKAPQPKQENRREFEKIDLAELME